MFKTAMSHYNEYKSDEFDFHSFNHRICSLISEVEMVHSTDGFFKHKDFFVSATKTIEILLLLLKNPSLIQQQKEQIKKEEEERKNENTVSTLSATLAFPENPLEEAHKLCKTLEKYNSHRIETHLLSFQVNMERKKYMLALKALKSAYSIDSQDYRVNLSKIQFFSFVPSQKLNPTLLGVIETESKQDSGLSGLTPLQYIDQKMPCTNTLQRFGVAKSLLVLDQKAHLERISQLFLSDNSPSVLSHSVDAYNLLLELELKDVAEKYKSFCTSSFPFSTFFGNQKIPTVQEDLHDSAYEDTNKKDDKETTETEEDKPTQEEGSQNEEQK